MTHHEGMFTLTSTRALSSNEDLGTFLSSEYGSVRSVVLVVGKGAAELSVAQFNLWDVVLRLSKSTQRAVILTETVE